MKQSINLERALRLLLCIAVIGVLCVVPASAAGNEYAQKGAQWILDGVYWIALVALLWQLFKMIAAKNITGAVIMGALGAIVIVLITRPEILKSVGEKLLGIVGVS